MATLKTLQKTGSSSNRVDMVFLGDGYTASQLTTYANDVKSYLAYVFGGTALTDPFSRYKNFFNVFAIEVVSQQSGADDPSRGITVNTALNARYFFDGVTERLMYIDDSKADAVVASTLTGTGIGSEMLYVTVNEAKYGGGGGKYGVFAGGNSSAHEIGLHEIGHSFADLADEYGGFPGPYTGAEPTEINVSKSNTGSKWSEWLGYNDPILGTVGAYQGGFYNDTGIWRPTLDSKMRSLDRPFDPIAREEFIHRFYALVNPFDSYSNNTGTKLNVRALKADVIDPAVILVDWTINGKKFAKAGEAFSLDAKNYTWGTYTVTAFGYDPTPWVRGDRSDLQQKVTWKIVNDYRLNGTTSSEKLTGNDNAQSIVGGNGNDTLAGLGGNDTLFGNAGADKLSGGTGSDTASYQKDGTVSVSLDGSLTRTGAAVGDTFNSIENLYGSAGGDRLSGNATNNILKGLSGNDAIWGKDGNDQIYGNSGIDTLRGGSGIDKFGFVARTDAGDIIADFSASDFLVFEGSAFGLGSFAGTLSNSRFASRTTGHAATDADDRFIFDQDSNELWFDSNGTGAGGELKIADLNNFSLAAGDILIV